MSSNPELEGKVEGETAVRRSTRSRESVKITVKQSLSSSWLHHVLRQETEEEKREGSASWKELFSNHNRMMYRTLLGMSLQLVHFSLKSSRDRNICVQYN